LSRPRFTMRHNAAESGVPADDVNHTCGFLRAVNVGIIASNACSGSSIASSRISRSDENPRPAPEIVRALNFNRLPFRRMMASLPFAVGVAATWRARSGLPSISVRIRRKCSCDVSNLCAE
jgi:hypothetical protein